MTVSFLFMLNLSKQNTQRDGEGKKDWSDWWTNELCHHWQLLEQSLSWSRNHSWSSSSSPFLGHIIDLCFVCRCCALNCCHLSIAIHQFIKRLHSQFNDRPPGQTPNPSPAQPSPAQPNSGLSQQTLSSECSQRFLQIIIIILLYRHEVVCIYQKRRVQVASWMLGGDYWVRLVLWSALHDMWVCLLFFSLSSSFL